MNLREQLAADIDIFFDVEEMATEHTLDGRPVMLVVDADQAQQNALKSPGGVFDGDLVVFVKTAELNPASVIPDSRIQLDNVPYTVSSSIDADGVTQLTLVGKRGY